MRPIQYKAWHKTYKNWVGCFTSGYIMDFSNGQVYSNGMNITDSLELVEYTGLNDSKGTPIYSSDIVRVDSPCSCTRGLVIFKDGCFFIKHKVFNNGKPEYQFYPMYQAQYNNVKFEVIGNQFENPELWEEVI